MKRALLISLMMSLFISFVSFASLAKEGMVEISHSGDIGARYIYHCEDGSYLNNEWKQVWDNWYYFGDDNCSKQSTWAEINGKWYYFNEWSVMLADTTTPDGYYVGADGAWVEEGTEIK